jgi:8-oxo-dGTP pyrophosphatase MutT (NUDIX family)
VYRCLQKKHQENEMTEDKVLYENEWYSLVKRNTRTGIVHKYMSVAVLPFTTDSSGMIDKIGLLKEYNPFREDNYSMTLITGTVEGGDNDLIDTVVREMMEEGGFKVSKDDVDRFHYLGSQYLSKDDDKLLPVFAVKVNGIEQTEASGDGSEKEEKSELEMVDVKVIMETQESLALGAFLKLFQLFYSKTK